MHDGLGQDLIAAKIVLDVAHRQGTAVARRDAGRRAKQAASSTAPSSRCAAFPTFCIRPCLDEVGLHSALQWYLEGLTKRSGIETFIDIQPPNFPRLTPELETTVFRIVQEALTNVFRHSGARKGWVTFSKAKTKWSFEFATMAKAFPAGQHEFRPDSIGIGIGGMRQRVKEFGGELRLAKRQSRHSGRSGDPGPGGNAGIGLRRPPRQADRSRPGSRLVRRPRSRPNTSCSTPCYAG